MKKNKNNIPFSNEGEEPGQPENDKEKEKEKERPRGGWTTVTE
jgi:hypothetical protein